MKDESSCPPDGLQPLTHHLYPLFVLVNPFLFLFPLSFSLNFHLSTFNFQFKWSLDEEEHGTGNQHDDAYGREPLPWFADNLNDGISFTRGRGGKTHKIYLFTQRSCIGVVDPQGHQRVIHHELCLVVGGGAVLGLFDAEVFQLEGIGQASLLPLHGICFVGGIVMHRRAPLLTVGSSPKSSAEGQEQAEVCHAEAPSYALLVAPATQDDQ